MLGSAESLRREWRATAYRRVLTERGAPHEDILATGGDHTEAGGYGAMQQLLAGSPRPRAVFATNDMMAIGAMVAIRNAGLRVPEDIAVAGFDDITVARLLNPPLTTVAQFPEQLGRRAAEMLFERLNGTCDRRRPAGRDALRVDDPGVGVRCRVGSRDDDGKRSEGRRKRRPLPRITHE